MSMLLEVSSIPDRGAMTDDDRDIIAGNDGSSVPISLSKSDCSSGRRGVESLERAVLLISITSSDVFNPAVSSLTSGVFKCSDSWVS